MSVVANVAINVDSRDATAKLNALNTGAGKLQQAFGGLGTALAGLGFGALTQQLGAAGLDADRTAKRIQSLAGANGEASKLFGLASSAAKTFGISTLEAQKGVAELYGRLRPAGISLSNIETVFNGVNKAAAAAGLTNADASGVFLQLSQALGSGALQGDELRSIMEQMPAVGQAVAKVMGVTVGEVKKLGSDGKITTDIMIKAAAELNKLAPPPPDPFKLFNAEMENLRVEIGENILPIVTPFVTALVGIAKAFGSLPEPVQTAIVALGLIVTAILAIGSAVAILAPVVSALGAVGSAIAAAFGAGGALAAAGPIIAGIATAFVTLITGPVGIVALIVAAGVAIYAFRDQIASIFGAIVSFIANAFSAIGGLIQAGAKAYMDYYVTPVIGFFSDLFVKIGSAVTVGFRKLVSIISAAARAYVNYYVTPVLGFFGSLFTNVATAVAAGFQKLVSIIRAAAEAYMNYYVKPVTGFFGDLFAKIGAVATNGFNQVLKLISNAAVQFKNTYIDPVLGFFKGLYNGAVDIFKKIGSAIGTAFQSVVGTIKAVFRSVLQYLAGRVNAVTGLINTLIAAFNRLPAPDIPLIPKLTIPEFAQGGVVSRPTLAMVGEGGEREYIVPESKMAAASANYLAGARGGNVLAGATAGGAPIINVTTGPVMEFNGERYVTVADMERAMRATANGVIGRLRTPSARTALGMA